MLFDDRQLRAGLDRMKKLAKEKGKSAAQQQAGALLGVVRAIGKKDGPTKQELFAKAEELKWRLKRKKGSAGRELKRRQRVAGLFGRRWLTTKFEQTGTNIRIWMENKLSYAQKINAKKKTFEKAAKKTDSKFRERLQKLAKQVTSGL